MGETLRVVNKIAFVLLFIVACISRAHAQSYPVQVNTSLTPPYSAFLADYSTPESQRFAVTFLMKDLTVIDYKGKLRLTIEGVGITIRTKQNFVPVHPITLYGGEPLTLFGSDLEEYFNPNNLDFAGISRSQYEKGAKLPEGVYRFTVEMLDYNRSSLVSNKGTAVAWIILNDPPLLNLPKADTKVKIVDPTNIAFTWTPRHTGSPNSAFTTEYVFKLIEVWPATRNPYDAFLSQQPLYEITTSETQIVYGPAEPALIPGRKYAWQVQAKDVDGKDLFKNQGKSEVYAFQFGDALGAPENFRKDGGYATLINLRWEPSQTGAAPQQYRVRYRPTNTDRPDIWYENVTNQLWITIPDLKADTEYDMQIRAEAKPQYSDYSALQSFRTEVKSPARYTCGKEGVYPPGDKSAMLMTLVPGNVITCRGFELLVTEVAGSAGNFTGKGWVKMMWFNGAGILSTFSGQVNSNYELVTGGYESVYDDGNEAAQDISDAYKIGEQPKQPSTTKDSTTTKVPDYIIAGTIDNVYVNDGGKIVVIDTEGNESTYEQKKDEKTGKVKETVVADASGTTYTVGADGTVTKASGSTSTTNSVAATIQPDPIKDRIIVLILEQFEEEIGAWLRINGKGGDDDPEVMLAFELPSCFNKDVGQLTYLNKNTIPYFKEHPAELRGKLEADQNNKILFDRIAGLFKSKDDVAWPKVTGDNQEASSDAMCKALMDDMAPLISFYEKVKPLLDADYTEAVKRVKAIVAFFKQCNSESWASYEGEGIIPYCFWRDQTTAASAYYSNADVPFVSGLIDGAYSEAEGLYHLPEVLKDISKYPGKVISAYTYARWKCSPDKIEASAKEYRYVIEQLVIQDIEGGPWNWFKEQWNDYESQKENLDQYFKDCGDAKKIRDGIDEVYNIVSSTDEIIKLYGQVSQKLQDYFSTLNATNNVARYKQGKLVVPVIFTVLTVGEASVTKIKKLRTALNSLREASAEKWKKVTEGIGKLVTKDVAKEVDEIIDVARATEKQLDDIFAKISKDPPYDYTPNTIEHKADRWAQYKVDKGSEAKDYKAWSNIYNGNMNKANVARQVEIDYMNSIGWGKHQVTVKAGNQTRRLDIADETLRKGVEVKAYETGKVYATEVIRGEVSVDKFLIEIQNWKIEWIFKGCEPSQPLRELLEKSDIVIKIVP